jgi:hypothetical protein
MFKTNIFNITTGKLYDLNIWGVSKPKGPNRIAKIDNITYVSVKKTNVCKKNIFNFMHLLMAVRLI